MAYVPYEVPLYVSYKGPVRQYCCGQCHKSAQYYHGLTCQRCGCEGNGGMGAGGNAAMYGGCVADHVCSYLHQEAQIANLSKKVDLLSSSCNAAREPAIEPGCWSRNVRRRSGSCFRRKSKQSEPLIVQSWVCVPDGQNWKTVFYTTEISPEGIAINSNTWYDPQLCSNGVAWAANGK